MRRVMSTYPDRPVAGSRIVITGATNGIGKEIARALVRRGALLTLLARDPAKASATVRELAAENGRSPRPNTFRPTSPTWTQCGPRHTKSPQHTLGSTHW